MNMRDLVQIAGFLVLVGGIFYNIVKTITIKDNHLLHLKENVEALLEGQDELKDKIGKNSERIAKIEGKVN